jgi:hypothetical protein
LAAFLGVYIPYFGPFQVIQHYPPVFRGCPGPPSNEKRYILEGFGCLFRGIYPLSWPFSGYTTLSTCIPRMSGPPLQRKYYTRGSPFFGYTLTFYRSLDRTLKLRLQPNYKFHKDFNNIWVDGAYSTLRLHNYAPATSNMNRKKRPLNSMACCCIDSFLHSMF